MAKIAGGTILLEKNITLGDKRDLPERTYSIER